MKRRTVTQNEIDDYVERSQNGPCFVCQIINGELAEQHNIIYRNEKAIVFLNRYPPLYGYTLVAPIEHREAVTGDFSEEEYLELQRLIYRVGEAVRIAVDAERVYILSLGSQQGNRHVHWHVAPLPAGTPYLQQQLEALNTNERGILELSPADKEELADRIRRLM